MNKSQFSQFSLIITAISFLISCGNNRKTENIDQTDKIYFASIDGENSDDYIISFSIARRVKILDYIRSETIPE